MFNLPPRGSFRHRPVSLLLPHRFSFFNPFFFWAPRPQSLIGPLSPPVPLELVWLRCRGTDNLGKERASCDRVPHHTQLSSCAGYGRPLWRKLSRLLFGESFLRRLNNLPIINMIASIKMLGRNTTPRAVQENRSARI